MAKRSTFSVAMTLENFTTGRNLSSEANTVGHPQFELMGKFIDDQYMGYTTGLATMRIDGFASIDGYESDGFPESWYA